MPTDSSLLITSDPESAEILLSEKAHAAATQTTKRTSHILGLLEEGFIIDSTRFRKLEHDLTETLHRARNFGTEYGSPDDWNEVWRQRWDCVESILRRLNLLVSEMDDTMTSDDHDHLQRALTTWKSIQSEDVRLVHALSELRTQALSLAPISHKDWNTLAQTLEMHMETIHSCSQALRAKLELLNNHSKIEVDALVKNLVAHLPTPASASEVSAAKYAQEYDKTVIELQEEQHHSGGLLDTNKTMFMWMESPEERISKNRSLRIESQ